MALQPCSSDRDGGSASMWSAAKALVVETYNGWSEDRAPSMGAAIAYYTVFSIAPVLILVVALAGLAFGQEAARGAIYGQLDNLLGPEGAAAVQDMIKSAQDEESGILATIIGLALLSFAATGVFVELQSSLNVIWRAPASVTSGLWAFVRTRLLSLSLIISFGFVLLVSLVVSAGISAFGAGIQDRFVGYEILLTAINFVISLAINTVIFAAIYKVLPDVYVAWRDVWVGAAVTAFLFNIGKILIGLYIGKSDLASSYGAAGALIVLLVWVYYASQIFLFGAEFTRAWARRRGRMIEPAKTPADSGV